ncbi:MAG: hypothetical protein HZY76_10355 [Anaerolineae bacterium]|nr:MAG: hypothetical protein HZY76_10355 [Anaerolineae bacterium]
MPLEFGQQSRDSRTQGAQYRLRLGLDRGCNGFIRYDRSFLTGHSHRRGSGWFRRCFSDRFRGRFAS